MAKRHKMSKRASKRSFTRNAMKTHKKNLAPPSGNPMRGGIRL